MLSKKLYLRFSILSLIIALIIFVIIFFVKGFYEKSSPNNLPRLFYCVAFVLIGFFLLLFKLYGTTTLTRPTISLVYWIIHYLIFTLVLASLIFSLLHLSENTSGYLFYFLAAPISITAAYLVDDYLNIVKGIGKNKAGG